MLVCGKKVWKATLQEHIFLALPRAGRGMGRGDAAGADDPSGAALTHPTTLGLPSPHQSPSSATQTKWRIGSVFLICIRDTPVDTAGLSAIMSGGKKKRTDKAFYYFFFYFQA